eukprot:tig00020830_g14439.t1
MPGVPATNGANGKHDSSPSLLHFLSSAGADGAMDVARVPEYLAESIPLRPIEKLDVVEFLRDETPNRNRDEAFYVVDLGAVARKHQQWLKLFPRVKPFYAVKCNPDQAVIKTLAALGAGFDCASKTEILQVLDCGVDPSRIIFANPCKAAPQVRFAQSANVKTMTFDNAAELHKLARMMPDAELVLRMYTEDSHSLIPLGSKFGAPFDQCESLLRLAKELELKVIGVSFHVGSGCFSVDAFVDAVRQARRLFDKAVEVGLPPFTLLDLGGGFPGSDSGQDGISFSEICAALNPLLDELFPAPVEVIAEPGRYYVCSAYTLAASVFGKRRFIGEAASEISARVAKAKEAPPAKAEATFASDDSLCIVEAARALAASSDGEDGGSSTIGSSDGVILASGQPRSTGSGSACGGSDIPTVCGSEDGSCDEREIAVFAEEEKVYFHYWISDGVYGSFKDRLLLNAEFLPHVVAPPGTSAESLREARTHRCSLFGPTHDSLDVIGEGLLLPELEVGQWLFFLEMGAYTSSLASQFNGFGSMRFCYVWSM